MDYTIKGTGTSGAKALKDLSDQLDKTNTKLEKAGTSLLTKPSSLDYGIHCVVTDTMSADFMNALEKDFSGDSSFEDALKKAKKDYGNVGFKAEEYFVSQTYKINDNQSKALGLTKSTPAGKFHEDTDILDHPGRYLK